MLPRPSNATPTISLLAGRRYQWGQNATRRYSKNSKRESGYGLSLENLHHYLSRYKGKAYKILVTEDKALTILALGGLSYDNGLPAVGSPPVAPELLESATQCIYRPVKGRRSREKVEDVYS